LHVESLCWDILKCVGSFVYVVGLFLVIVGLNTFALPSMVQILTVQSVTDSEQQGNTEQLSYMFILKENNANTLQLKNNMNLQHSVLIKT